MTIDSHCHLNQEDYENSIQEMILEAKNAGVHHIMGVACEPKDWNELLTLLKMESDVYGAIGIHPEYANKENQKALENIPKLFKENPKLLAVGEIGLDYHEAPKTKEEQKKLFYTQIQIAHKVNKPIMIHTREAETDTLVLLLKAQKEGLLTQSGVIHCFTGSKEFASAVLKLGFYISASGVITFKSAHTLREIFSEIPNEKLLVETDAPWLTPEPFRGRKNHPAYTQKTLEKLAEIKGLSVQKMEKITDDNFNNLYLGGKIR